MAAAYHHQSGPGAPVRHATHKRIRALLVKYWYNFSLREIEERLNSNMIIRWFVGYSLFDPPPDHSTLERFEVWLQENQHYTIFGEILGQIRQEYPDEHHIQIGDSYAIRANAARENLVPQIGLCQSGARRALEALAHLPTSSIRCWHWGYHENKTPVLHPAGKRR